jgi:putative N6-adenine-specific DNA methylase
MRPQTYDCYAITPPGEESITARELLALGIDPRASEPGGVSFRTDAGGIGRANVELRTASRVIVRVATCHASAFHELERRADRLPWEAYVPPGRSVAFRVYFPKVEALPSGCYRAAAGRVGHASSPGRDCLAWGFGFRGAR